MVDFQNIENFISLVRDQFFDKAKNDAINNGFGMAIFRLLPEILRTSNSNVSYYYATKSDPLFDYMINVASFDQTSISSEMNDIFLLCCIVPGEIDFYDVSGKIEVVKI